MSDRRARFFVFCAVVALLLIPFTPEDFDYVSVIVALWCLVLGALSALDAYSQHGE